MRFVAKCEVMLVHGADIFRRSSKPSNRASEPRLDHFFAQHQVGAHGAYVAGIGEVASRALDQGDELLGVQLGQIVVGLTPRVICY